MEIKQININDNLYNISIEMEMFEDEYNSKKIYKKIEIEGGYRFKNKIKLSGTDQYRRRYREYTETIIERLTKEEVIKELTKEEVIKDNICNLIKTPCISFLYINENFDKLIYKVERKTKVGEKKSKQRVDNVYKIEEIELQCDIVIT